MGYSLFISDSLGLPTKGSNSEFDDTILGWLSGIGNVWILSHTGATVTEYRETVQELTDIIDTNFFDIAVIQLGLSDCAPRPLAMQWRDRLSRLRPLWLKKRIIKFLHNHRAFIQKHIGYYQRTPFDKFERDFTNLLIMLSGLSKQMVVVLMPPVSDSLNDHSPGIRYENRKYNDFMRQKAEQFKALIIDEAERMEAEPAVYLTNDGHLSGEGHKLVKENYALRI